MSDVLEFAGVSVVRGDNTLLDDITWEVEEGQRWVILGPNGAGKTTLLQLAAGRIHPTTGIAGVLGEVLGVVDVFDLRPRIGLCSAAIAERLPGDELVRDVVVTASYGIVGRWHESYDALDHARAADLLEALGAAHLAERAFGTLSEGERKRVQIARALMTDPELMLLDEPAAGLDLGGREDLVARLGALAADLRAPALVLVTHHVEEIPPSFTDVLLMRAGRIVAAGPLEITLTAANLSETFALPLVVERHGRRWSARAAEVGVPPSPAPPPRAASQDIPVSSTVLVH
jgi:iron complex transport system ATP-binding protein